MNISKKQINIYTAVVFGAMFFMCMSNNIVGPLLGDIMQYYTIRLDGGGLMSMYQSIGGTAAIILFSFIIDKLNKTIAFIVPMLFVALSLLLIGTAPPYAVFMLLFLFFGISLSTLDMTGNAIVPDVQQEKCSSALSLMHGTASIGAVAAPLIAGGITEAGLPWQSVYTAVGFFMLFLLAVYILASLYARTSLKTIKTVHLKSRQKGEAGKFITDKKVWAAILSTLMFGGFQSGIVVWVAQYFKEALGSGQLAAGFGLTAYWLGTGIVRLLFGFTPLQKLQARPVNICGCIASGVVLAAGMLTGNYGIMLACVFVSGALNAPMLPRTMGLVSSWYPKSSGLSSSAIFGALYLAYAFFPLLMGSLAYAWGIHMLMIAPAVFTMLSGAIALLLPKENNGMSLTR